MSSAIASPDWWAEARRLRDEGLTVREVAQRVGRARATVHEALKSPYRARCVACGDPIRRGQRCYPCRRAGEMWRRRRLLELVAGMYNDGWPLRDIADVLGRSVANGVGGAVAPELAEARRLGLLDGYRHPRQPLSEDVASGEVAS